MSTQKQQNPEDIPKTLTETLKQLTDSLDREADNCFDVAERRRKENPASAQGFQKRGMFINRQFNSARKSLVRVKQISSIMTELYNTKANEDGTIDLSKVLIGKEEMVLLNNVRERAVIPEVIHVLSFGSLFAALMQYPM